MKKITITGPHCCGKSTVLRKVQEYLKEYNDIRFEKFDGSLSPVDYSSSQKLRDECIEELNITYWMIANLINREVNIEYSNDKIVVLDRCIIDQIVYPSVLLKKEFHEKIFGFIETWLRTHPYDIVFYVPKNNELLQKYGQKDKSEEYLNEIEEKYIEILKKLNINYTVLPKNQDKQVEYIVKYLKSLVEVNESE